MADNKQLEILKKGVKEWNAWRIDNRGVEIDLTRAYLANADLTGAHFLETISAIQIYPM